MSIYNNRQLYIRIFMTHQIYTYISLAIYVATILLSISSLDTKSLACYHAIEVSTSTWEIESKSHHRTQKWKRKSEAFMVLSPWIIIKTHYSMRLQTHIRWSCTDLWPKGMVLPLLGFARVTSHGVQPSSVAYPLGWVSFIWMQYTHTYTHTAPNPYIYIPHSPTNPCLTPEAIDLVFRVYSRLPHINLTIN